MTRAWIPNSLTMGNLLFGFISIIYSSYGTLEGFFIAGFLILAAALLDGLDGPVARALKVAGPLGRELDSLADCVAFGLAPGFLGFKAYFSGMNYLVFGMPIDSGIFIASVFPICAAYRLARFNILSEPGFRGLPSPLAGIIIALIPIYNLQLSRTFFGIIFIVIGLLMVSTFKYTKPNSYILQNIHGIKLVIFILILALILIFFKQWTVFIVIALYIMSGIFSFIIQFIQDHKY